MTNERKVEPNWGYMLRDVPEEYHELYKEVAAGGSLEILETDSPERRTLKASAMTWPYGGK